jgi:hypothetical protein
MYGVSFRLLALFSPGSAEAELGRLQADIFSVHGLASAQSLPPLMPIAFLDRGASTRGLLRGLDRGLAAPWNVTIEGPVWVQGVLYMAVDSGGAWGALREATLRSAALSRAGLEPVAEPAAEPAALFPAFEGMLIGCAGAAEEQREAIRPELMGLSFSSGALTLLDIEAPAGPSQWWRELYWETLEQVPLRGRRQE